MIDLDDLDQLYRSDSQGLLQRAGNWQERRSGLDFAEVDAAWLNTCRPETAQIHNPAKQLAVQCYDRVPLIWATTGLTAVARSWQQRIQWYAEAAAISASLDEMARDWSMARFPRFWGNAVVCVYLGNTTEAEDVQLLVANMQLLLRQRHVQSISVALPAVVSCAAAQFHCIELGEWVALYLAALYGVDPADRVPWQYLDIVEA